jgi:hypothetical protein
MINNLNDQNLPSSTNSALASFGGFPAPEKSRLGTIVKLCSNVDSKEKNLALEKAREYRKRNIKLKDRAGRFSISRTKRNKLQYVAVGNVVLMAAPL